MDTLNNYEVVNKISSYAVKNVITELRPIFIQYHDNYHKNLHALTPKLLNELIIECDVMLSLLNGIDLITDDKAGTLIVVYRIIMKQLEIINKMVNSLSLIPENETSLQYLNKKVKAKSFQFQIPYEINILRSLNDILKNLIYIETNKDTLTTEDLFKIVEETYLYPFWYNFTFELSTFRDLLDLYKSTFIKSHNSTTILKPLGMFGGAVHNIYNRAYNGSHISSNKIFTSMKENESVELLQYMWNQGDKGIGYGAISFILPKIHTVEWIKINKIECLILSNNKLPFDLSKNLDSLSINKNINLDINVNIVLHFHGGGFISGSPHTHESYLRKWAIDTNTVIFSVNYSKSPEAKYPTALNECYSVYKLLVEGRLFGFVPNKIILAGDSAGGNLAVAVTIKAIRDETRIPDGLLLAYPAIDCDKTITLSRYLFSYDFLLSYNLLMLCANSYLGNDGNPKDELVSPLYASDDVLKQFPDNIFIHNAGYCPLLDDSVNFIKRLKQNNKQVRQWIFDLPHGFWCFGHLMSSVGPIIKLGGKQINFMIAD